VCGGTFHPVGEEGGSPKVSPDLESSSGEVTVLSPKFWADEQARTSTRITIEKVMGIDIL